MYNYLGYKMNLTSNGATSTLIQIASAEIKKYWNCITVILKDSYMYNSYTTAMKKRAYKNERERNNSRKDKSIQAKIQKRIWVKLKCVTENLNVNVVIKFFIVCDALASILRKRKIPL